MEQAMSTISDNFKQKNLNPKHGRMHTGFFCKHKT